MRKQPASPCACSPRAAALIECFGTSEALLAAYNPGRQADFAAQPERCVTGRAPTLAEVDAAFGKGTGAAFVVPQLYNLSEFCGCREKLTEAQLEETARLIAAAYPWLRLTELMLFFHRLKLGLYGRFYGSVDPMAITSALRAFLADRAAIIDRALQRQAEQEWAEAKRKAVSYEEWLMMKNDNTKGNDKCQ